MIIIKNLFIAILCIFYTQIFSQQAEVVLMMGNAKDELGDYDGAIKDYTEAIRIKPDYAVAFFNRALTKRRIDDFKGAIEDYSHAIRINNSYAEAYHNRGIVYALLNKKTDACNDWEKAFSFGHNDAKKLLNFYCYTEEK